MNNTNFDYPNRRTKMLFLLIVLITLSKYSLQIGFSLKLYMVFLFLFFLLNFSSFSFAKLYGYEMALLAFYLFYSFTGSLSIYSDSSLRITLGVILILSCYFIMKFVMSRYSVRLIETAIGNAGVIFNLASLALYLIGLHSLQLGFAGGDRSEYGVLVDRGYPRLIGLLDDPNIYVFYNTLFFFYFLCSNESWKHRLGLVLCITTNLLTFSRGGLAALLIVLIIYMFMNKPRKQLKLMFSFTFFLSIVAYIAVVFMKFDVISILEQRMKDFQTDGGSGRFELWSRGIEYFASHPFIGIGAFNFSDYNYFHYGERLYAHNTFIEILAESGVIGFFLYLLFLILAAWKMIVSGIYRTSPYLFFTFVAFLLQMVSLSLIINEMFFAYLAVLYSYLIIQKQEGRNYELQGREVS